MKIDRSIAPSLKGEIEFKLPEIKSLSLSNGLKVLFIERNFLPLIKMQLITSCGSIYDPEGKNGLANLFSMMIDEGADEFNSLELSEEFDMLGSSFTISCNHDNVFLSLQTLTENFERSLELLSKVILKPHFDLHDFKREQNKVRVTLMQQHDDAEILADLAFSHLIHARGAYGNSILGYEDSVDQIVVDDVIDFYKNFFAPENSHLVISGNISETVLINLLEKYLNQWNNRKKNTEVNIKRVFQPRSIYILNKENSVQTEIRIGHQAEKRNSLDYFPKTIMNMILGGQFVSRINLNLREAKGFTYGASSNFTHYKNLSEFCTAVSVSTDNSLAAVNEIILELNKIKEGVTLKELLFAKDSLIRRFPLQFESNSQIITNLSALAIHELPVNYFNEYLNNIRQVNQEDVKSAAIKNLKLDELSILLVGNQREIAKQLSKSQHERVNYINFRGEIIG